MFLNWVYRTNASGGFLNRSWKPTDNDQATGMACHLMGCAITTQRGVEGSGDGRMAWMEEVMIAIFQDQGW
jgi:hypothetical protein